MSKITKIFLKICSVHQLVSLQLKLFPASDFLRSFAKDSNFIPPNSKIIHSGKAFSRISSPTVKLLESLSGPKSASLTNMNEKQL